MFLVAVSAVAVSIPFDAPLINWTLYVPTGFGFAIGVLAVIYLIKSIF